MSEKKKSPEEYLKDLEQRFRESNQRVLQAKDDVIRMQSVLVDAQQHMNRILQEIVGVKDAQLSTKAESLRKLPSVDEEDVEISVVDAVKQKKKRVSESSSAASLDE